MCLQWLEWFCKALKWKKFMKNHKQFTSLDSQISIGYQISIAISVSDATTTTLKSGISLNMNHSSGSWSESCAKGCRISIYIEFKFLSSIVYFSIFSRFFFSLFVLIHELKVLLIDCRTWDLHLDTHLCHYYWLYWYQ